MSTRCQNCPINDIHKINTAATLARRVIALTLTLLGEWAYLAMLRRSLLEAQVFVTLAELMLIVVVALIFFREPLTIWRGVGLLASVVAVVSFTLPNSFQ